MRRGYLFIIRADDGGHVTNTALKLEHDSNTNDKYRWLTSSSAMFFTNYGKVVIAWHEYRSKLDDSDGY